MRQYLETNQLRYYVVLVIYILTYILHTQDTERYLLHTLHRVHLHSQTSQGSSEGFIFRLV